MVAGTYQYSGTTNFGTNLTIPEIVEDAFMRAGMPANDVMQQRDYRYAVRQLNYIFSDLDSLGSNSWTKQLATTTPTQAQQTFSIAANAIDIDQMIVTPTNGFDILMTRMSQDQWLALPDKTQQGRPTNYFVNRTIPTALVYIWPVPDAVGYVLTWFQSMQIQDALGGGDENCYIPMRFAEAITAQLAWRLAILRAPERVQMLQQMAEQMLFDAFKGDGNKVPLSLQVEGYWVV